VELSGKVALVTGASRGIGRAVAELLGSRGAKVAVNYERRPENAAEVARGIEQRGGEAMVVQADVSQASQVESMIAQVTTRWGPVDILVNNAGIYPHSLFIEMPEEEWDRVLAVNLKGTFLCSKAVVSPMKEKKWGRIINMTASSGLRGSATASHYAASKGGMIGLTKSMAVEVALFGITVNAVAPTTTDTDMPRGDLSEEESRKKLERQSREIPMGRIGRPEEVADAVLFLVRESGNYITGQVVCVNGGSLMR